ncbi:hypothetical protein [Aeribacillus pallidus]|uniref:hypothetical protein n=1 Tax=Aeribacillus pallidus TaxID=33936 RepID=UPI003D23CB05
MNWAFVLFLVVFLFDIILAFSNLKNEKWLFYEHIFRALMFGWLALATWTQMDTFYLLAIVSFVITVAIVLAVSQKKHLAVTKKIRKQKKGG